ncbi:MAG: TatD family hydrolase [Betaproteobacteria bacterium]
MNYWIDTHCHLDAAEFDADRDAVYAAARAAGIAEIVVPAIGAANFPAVKACCRRYAGCQPAYGIHPLYVADATPADLATLRSWLATEKALAVGEIGLDFHVPGGDQERQQLFFSEQLKIAREFDLPVLLHVRRAVDAILLQLKRIGVRGGIAHAFNGSRQQADQFIEMGFKLGFGGTLTFEGSRRIRELAATLPLEAIVLETDAPDIPPAWLGRGRNAPDELPRIAAILAELRGCTPEEIAAATTSNARAVLRRDAPNSTIAESLS